MNDSIEIRNIYKAYDDKQVLSDLSLSIAKGKVTCITGPSGCGKTTLLRIMAGLEKADSGTVENEKANVAFVFQEDRLAEDFSALSNVRLATGKRVDTEVIRRHLEELGLEGHIDRPVRELSGGMKRRVSIARAVCYDADILFMDEPFKGLDAKLKIEVMDYVKRHTETKTVIFVTHDRTEADFFDAVTIDIAKKC